MHPIVTGLHSFYSQLIDLLGRLCCLQSSGPQYKNFRVSMSNADDGDNPIVVDGAGGAGARASPYHGDWMTVATVLDRFFLCLFLVVLLLGVIIILA